MSRHNMCQFNLKSPASFPLFWFYAFSLQRSLGAEASRSAGTPNSVLCPVRAVELKACDSVVIVVNDREEWRGVYDPCAHDFPLRRGTPNGTERAAAATDTVTSLEIVHGRDAATRFGIGTAHAVAYVIRATPRRH